MSILDRLNSNIFSSTSSNPWKVMERLMIPFVALLVLLFLYVTYQDVIRLFSRLFW